MVSIPRPSEAQEERKGLHCIHLNVRSLLPKMSQLRIIANKTSAAVIALTETWIDNSVTNSEISIDGYTVLRKDEKDTAEVFASILKITLLLTKETI